MTDVVDVGPFIFVFSIGVVVGLLCTLPFSTGTCVWQTAAIEHKAAHYDAVTGKFTWNVEKP